MVRDLSPGPGLTAAIWRLASTAAQALNTHVNEHGQCTVCHISFPCPVACVAETNLSALTQPKFFPRPADRSRTPLPSRVPAPSPGPARDRTAGAGPDLPTLRRVLAGLQRLDAEPPANPSPAARTAGLRSGVRNGAPGPCS
jgi:hypothetical protein